MSSCSLVYALCRGFIWAGSCGLCAPPHTAHCVVGYECFKLKHKLTHARPKQQIQTKNTPTQKKHNVVQPTLQRCTQDQPRQRIPQTHRQKLSNQQPTLTHHQPQNNQTKLQLHPKRTNNHAQPQQKNTRKNNHN